MNVNETRYDTHVIIIAGVLGNGTESVARVNSSSLVGDKDIWNDLYLAAQ
jgi:hypothetical protein